MARVADRLPRRGARVNATHADAGRGIVYSPDYEPSGPFVMILGSGVRRNGDIPSCAVGASVTVVLVDVKLGGAAHDLTDENVVRDLASLASNSHCLTVYSAAPCRTWCAARRIHTQSLRTS